SHRTAMARGPAAIVNLRGAELTSSPTYVKPSPVPVAFGSALLLASGLAIGGAVIVGAFYGISGYQSTYVSILLGWAVGMVICRAGREIRVAAAASALALTGSAVASVIGAAIGVVKIAHVPAAVVVSHISRVISLLPHVIGWFGFLC